MPGKENRQVFTYQTRVSVTAEQDKRLREYGVLFGRVERTLYGGNVKGRRSNRLKSGYLVRFAITASIQRRAHPVTGQDRRHPKNCFPYKSSTYEPRSA